ncbi:unnamed protein product [Haemonchus placei]|uniref:Uncharacterized protein n=1 Tax=Haemonchus placei TaxID=6290 RepID=A0A0N4X5Y7_HAEPC|nr:unnamed protein product [Haemonchus placei]
MFTVREPPDFIFIITIRSIKMPAICRNGETWIDPGTISALSFSTLSTASSATLAGYTAPFRLSLADVPLDKVEPS